MTYLLDFVMSVIFLVVVGVWTQTLHMLCMSKPTDPPLWVSSYKNKKIQNRKKIVKIREFKIVKNYTRT